jgi:hypothetical protein
MIFKEMGCDVVEWVHIAQHIGPVANSCDHGSGVSVSMKGERFFDRVRNC